MKDVPGGDLDRSCLESLCRNLESEKICSSSIGFLISGFEN